MAKVRQLEWHEVVSARSDEDPTPEHTGDYEARILSALEPDQRIALAVEALTKANERLPGIKTPMMGGDNLAVLLCSFFDDGDKDTEDDDVWGQRARDGYEEVIAAIRAHYAATLSALRGEGNA